MHCSPAGVTWAWSTGTRNVAGPRGLQRQVVWGCDLAALLCRWVWHVSVVPSPGPGWSHLGALRKMTNPCPADEPQSGGGRIQEGWGGGGVDKFGFGLRERRSPGSWSGRGRRQALRRADTGGRVRALDVRWGRRGRARCQGMGCLPATCPWEGFRWSAVTQDSGNGHGPALHSGSSAHRAGGGAFLCL